MERLLLVRIPHQFTLVACRVNRLVGGKGHARSVLRGDPGVMSQRARRTSEDWLTDSLVRNTGYVVHLHTVMSFGGVDVFTAHLQTADRISGVLMSGLQLPMQLLVPPVVVRISV